MAQGREPPTVGSSGAQPGRALSFADDPGWPDITAELNSPDDDASPELVSAVTGLLHQWRPERPDVIVPLPSPGQQRRARSLATQLSQRLRIPLDDAFTWTGDPVPANLPSGRHVQQVEEQLRFRGDSVSGRVLLVAASGRTMWTATVAAALLRDAGADEVIPVLVRRLP